MKLSGSFYTPVYQTPLFAWKDALIDVDYSGVRCPVAEKASYKEMIWLPHEVFLGTTEDIDDICNAIEKIRTNLDELVSRSDATKD